MTRKVNHCFFYKNLDEVFWSSVTMIKLDPYLQIDAGTMSPFEHGETFVTKDGFETDLDL